MKSEQKDENGLSIINRRDKTSSAALTHLHHLRSTRVAKAMAQDGTALFAIPSSSTPSMAPPIPANSSSSLIGGVTRKQNIACDQCRSRKTRCLRGDKKDVVSFTKIHSFDTRQ